MTKILSGINTSPFNGCGNLSSAAHYFSIFIVKGGSRLEPPCNKMRKIIRKIVPLLIILIGLTLTCYPWISEYVYEHGVQSLVETYKEDSQSLDDKEKEELLAQARKYNEVL